MTLDDQVMASINGYTSPQAPSGRDWPETAGVDLADEIKQIVADYVEMSDPFTAHTITRKLRAKFPNVEIEHDVVRDFIHQWYDLNDDNVPGYERARSHFRGSPYIYMYIG